MRDDTAATDCELMKFPFARTYRSWLCIHLTSSHNPPVSHCIDSFNSRRDENSGNREKQNTECL